jgi:sugar/nucleoside kinase (ribokinase family)
LTDFVTDVLIAGRVFSDLVFTGVHAPAPGSEVLADGFAISAGGAANRAVASARLGAHTALVTEFGDDPIGLIVAQTLRDEHRLDLSHSVTRTNYQIPISVAITDGHDRAFVTYEQPGEPPKWPASGPIRVAHVGLGRELPPCAARLRASGTTLVGGVGWDPSGEWSQTLLDRLAEVDVLILNEVEALGYTRAASPEAALEILAECIGFAVITMGTSGVIAAHGDTRVHVPAIVVDAVDPTGAGDAFAAGFMAATAWQWELERRLRLATVSAACSVRSAGGARSAPYPRDIADLLDGHRHDDGWSFIRQWADQHRTTPSHPTRGVLLP